MDFSRMVSLFSHSLCVAQPSVLLMFIGSVTGSGDGKGCFGVSQDTPSVWGSWSCQPDYPLPASLRSLWLRFKQNTELKQKEREGISAQMKAPVPNCITETFNSGEPITPEGCVILCSCSALKTHTHVFGHTHFLSLTLTQIPFSWSYSSDAVVPSYRKSYFWNLERLVSLSQILW